MEQTEQATAAATAKSTLSGVELIGVERRRVEKVVETLATLRGRGESIAEVAHDARNMVTALGLYCDLLEEPGVLAIPFAHYAQELRLVATASRRLVEKLVVLDAGAAPDGVEPGLLQAIAQHRATVQSASMAQSPATAISHISMSHTAAASGGTTGSAAANSCAAPSGPALSSPAPSHVDMRSAVGEDSSPIQGSGPGTGRGWSSAAGVPALRGRNRRWDLEPAVPISNLATELLSNRNLLSALAGSSIALTIEAGGAQAVRLTGENLTRVLVNLVKNAAEAMPQGGLIHIGLGEPEKAPGSTPCLVLTVEDNGPGIPEKDLEKIFNSGYTTRGTDAAAAVWAGSHRGLGLAIVRSIVEGAGGRISAANLLQGGACFTLELPIRELPVRNTGSRQTANI